LLVSAGTAAAPSIAFSADADGSGTGIYRHGANAIGFSINGVTKVYLLSSGVMQVDGLLDGQAIICGANGVAAGNSGTFKALGSNVGAACTKLAFDFTPGSGTASFGISGTAITAQKGDGTAGGSFTASGKFATGIQTTTLAAAATTLAVTQSVVSLTGDAGGNTLATITGGIAGMRLVLIFQDALVTITDTAAATADTVNLSAAFTSSANDVLELIHNGTKWLEVSRSVN